MIVLVAKDKKAYNRISSTLRYKKIPFEQEKHKLFFKEERTYFKLESGSIIPIFRDMKGIVVIELPENIIENYFDELQTLEPTRIKN